MSPAQAVGTINNSSASRSGGAPSPGRAPDEHHEAEGTTTGSPGRHDDVRCAPKWRLGLENFTPMWFAVCISSGGLGLVLNSPFPYPASWLSTCGDILFVVDLVLFVLFAAVMLVRWAVCPRPALRRLLAAPEELAAYAIMPITLLTLAALTASQVSTAAWGGHAFTIVAYVLWWAGMACILLFCVTAVVVIVRTGLQREYTMTPALFMPVVGVATAASEAGFIAMRADGISARMAVPMVVMGYFLLGMAAWLGLMLYTIFLHRLLTTGWPAPPGIAGLAILVGPSGQIATAFQALGKAARQGMQFAEYDRGTFFTQQTGMIIEGAGLLFALLFIGLAFFWFMIALYAIVDVAFVRREATYNLSWWAIVFPIVTLDTALLDLGTAMDSPAFRVLATALFVFLLVAYFTNWAFTIWFTYNGKLLFGVDRTELKEKRMTLDSADSV